MRAIGEDARRAAPPPARRRPRGPHRSRCGACRRTSPTSSACTNAAPAFSLMARSPSVPSDPMPGQNHADAALLLVLGERAKEEVDGQVQSPGRRLRQQVQLAVQQRHVLVRRDHVDVIGLDRQADPSPARTGIVVARWSSSTSIPLCVGSRCWTTTKAMPLSAGTLPQKLLERLQPPGGGTDADDGEPRRFRRRGRAGGLRGLGGTGASGRAGGLRRSSRLLRARAVPSRCTRARGGLRIGHTRRLFRRASCPTSAPALHVLGQCTTPWF